MAAEPSRVGGPRSIAPGGLLAREGHSVIRAARYAYAVVAWAAVAAIILQVFFIGLGLFDGSEKLELHRTFGWILHLVAIIVPISAALAAAGRTRILLAILLAAMVWAVPILAALRSDAPLVA